jgi:hypothetical protein
MTSRSGIQQAHPAVVAYAKRAGMNADAFRSGGRLTVRIDGRHRIHMQAAAAGRLAITARHF